MNGASSSSSCWPSHRQFMETTIGIIGSQAVCLEGGRTLCMEEVSKLTYDFIGKSFINKPLMEVAVVF